MNDEEKKRFEEKRKVVQSVSPPQKRYVEFKKAALRREALQKAKLKKAKKLAKQRIESRRLEIERIKVEFERCENPKERKGLEIELELSNISNPKKIERERIAEYERVLDVENDDEIREFLSDRLAELIKRRDENRASNSLNPKVPLKVKKSTKPKKKYLTLKEKEERRKLLGKQKLKEIRKLKERLDQETDSKKRNALQQKISKLRAHGRRAKGGSVWTVSGGLPSFGKRS
jgi:hypothetical protein